MWAAIRWPLPLWVDVSASAWSLRAESEGAYMPAHVSWMGEIGGSVILESSIGAGKN